MSLTKKVSQTSDANLNNTNKPTTLNPNAAEFVPFALRLPSPRSTSTLDVTDRHAASSSTVGKGVLDWSESSASHHSDEEAREFWSHQLPDDITPDFKVMSEDDRLHGIGNLSLASLSLHDANETARFPASAVEGHVSADQPGLSSHNINGNSYSGKIRFPISSFREDPQQANFMCSTLKSWDKQIMNGDQLHGSDKEGHPYNGNSQHGFMNDMISGSSYIGEIEVNPVAFLASQFPEFAAESLAEVYYANGCDVHLTIEMLTQLELQVDGSLNQSISSKTLSTPNLSAMDFPALTMSESQSISAKFDGDDFRQTGHPYRSAEKDNILLFNSSSSIPQKGSIDFASAVRKLASQDSRMWKYQRNDSVDSTVGSSRNSHGLAGALKGGTGRNIYAEKLQNRVSNRSAPIWVETGDAVANMYSELREEARDHACLRNAYFEQARQAYLIGNKALAKELSVKGQLHNVQMKAAHGKAQEAIYRRRNLVGSENVRGNQRMIDLHGLHVSEAIQVLKHELSVLRSTAHAADQRLQVYICVGTGHHTRGSRTPARLPVAVQRFLLEEGIEYSEPQPGLLGVVIY